MFDMEETKKLIAASFVSMIAGIVSFFLALNLRSLILEVYIFFRAGQTPWAASFINAASIIILMILWIIYIFYTHHYFEKKSAFTKAAYLNALKRFVLPVAIAFILSEVLIRLY